jgi:hypothetical protein
LRIIVICGRNAVICQSSAVICRWSEVIRWNSKKRRGGAWLSAEGEIMPSIIDNGLFVVLAHALRSDQFTFIFSSIYGASSAQQLLIHLLKKVITCPVKL